MDKTAQLWGIDLLVGIFLFTVGLAIFYAFSINYSGGEKESYENIIYDSERIMDLLLSEGYPFFWNKESVEEIGLTNGEKINHTKLEFFYEISQTNYDLSKELLGTKYEYFFMLDKNLTINGSIISGIGKEISNISEIDSENIIKQKRFSIYENTPCTAYLYLWE